MNDDIAPVPLDVPLEPPQPQPVTRASELPADELSQPALFELPPADPLVGPELAEALSPAPLPSRAIGDGPIEANAWKRMALEIVSGIQTLVSAAVYATLIVTFGFQVARVDGLSMAPTLED